MKTRVLLFTLILAICCPHLKLCAQVNDNFGTSVVFLVATPDAPSSECGTGFLVEIDGAHAFLATAAHVAHSLSEKSSVVIEGKDGMAHQFTIIQLLGQNTQPKWLYHDTADLAILPLSTAVEFARLALCFPLESLESKESAPLRQITLTICGFPLALGVSGRFSPITRETKAASDLLSLPRADTKTNALFFITQDPSVGGFSGGPVFDTGLPTTIPGAMMMRNSGLKIVGVVHGTLSDNTGGKFCAVTPAYQLLELINKTKVTLEISQPTIKPLQSP